jgi:hypothetical protein
MASAGLPARGRASCASTPRAHRAWRLRLRPASPRRRRARALSSNSRTVLRPEGKADAIVLNHSGAVFRHGLVRIMSSGCSILKPRFEFDARQSPLRGWFEAARVPQLQGGPRKRAQNAAMGRHAQHGRARRNRRADAPGAKSTKNEEIGLAGRLR